MAALMDEFDFKSVICLFIAPVPVHFFSVTFINSLHNKTC